MMLPDNIIDLFSLSCLAIGLFYLSWQDWRHQKISLKLLYLIALLGAVQAVLDDPIGLISPIDCLYGGLLGGLFLYAARIILGYLSKKNVLGRGDVQFFAMAGIWSGWQTILTVGFLAFLITLLITLPCRVRLSELGWKTSIPLIPGASIGLLIVLIYSLIGGEFAIKG